MRLVIPPEPKHLKELMKALKRRLDSLSGERRIRTDRLAAWTSNAIPSYLWRFWRPILRQACPGFRWQDLLKVVGHHTGDIVRWGLKDKMAWDELVARIVRTLMLYIKQRRFRPFP